MNQKKDKVIDKKKLCLEVGEKTMANITAACKHISISRETFYTWFDNDENFRKQWIHIAESCLDFAESMLFKKIAEGDIAAIIFYLKTKGKNRGYTTTQQVVHEVNTYSPLNSLNKHQIETITRIGYEEKFQPNCT